MRVLITGGSGLVGQKLTKLLNSKGHDVAWLSRSKRSVDGVRVFQWNVKEQTIDLDAIEWADGVIHLAGAGVADKRWTEARKAEILMSRTLSTKLLYTAIAESKKKPEAFVSASAVGYYGFTTSDIWLNESSPSGNDFLADVTVAWEHEIQQIATLGVPTSWIRIGIVLSRDGGALAEMTKPPVVAPLGSGNQWMPWIHESDLCQLFLHALHNKLQGAINGVAPKPELHSNFMRTLAKAASKLYLPIPAPTFVLRIALGEMADMLTNGTRVSTDHALETGFEFQHPSLKEALTDLYQ